MSHYAANYNTFLSLIKNPKTINSRNVASCQVYLVRYGYQIRCNNCLATKGLERVGRHFESEIWIVHYVTQKYTCVSNPYIILFLLSMVDATLTTVSKFFVMRIGALLCMKDL